MKSKLFSIRSSTVIASVIIGTLAPFLSGCQTVMQKANEFVLTTARIKADNESDFAKAKSEPFYQKETGYNYDNVVGQSYLSGICSAAHADPQKALSTYIGKRVLVKGLYHVVKNSRVLLYDGLMEETPSGVPMPRYNAVVFDAPKDKGNARVMSKWQPFEIHSVYGAIDKIVPYADSTRVCMIHLSFALPEDNLAAYISAKHHENTKND